MDLQVERHVTRTHLAFDVTKPTRKLPAFRADGNLRLACKLRPDPDEICHRLDRTNADHLGANGQLKFPSPIWL